MKRLTIYYSPDCAACEAALAVLAKYHANDVVVDRRNIAVCEWKLPDGHEVRLTPTYVLSDPRGHVIAVHANLKKPTLTLAELERFTKRELEVA